MGYYDDPQPPKNLHPVYDVRFSRLKGKWFAWRDGKATTWYGFDTRKAALEDLFPARQMGHNVGYYGECGVACAECIRATFLQDPEEVQTWTSYWEDDVPPTGSSCSFCSEYIVEPYCAVCFSERALQEPGYYINDNGEGDICARCMAQARVYANHPEAVPTETRWWVSAERIAPGYYAVRRHAYDTANQHVVSRGYVYYSPAVDYSHAHYDATQRACYP